MPSGKARLEMIPLAGVADNPFQIGYPPGEAEVARAAYLVRDQGLTIPLVVRRQGKGYQLGTGRQWLAACRMLGVLRVPALVADLPDGALAALAFEEASEAGQISPGHAAILRKAVADPWVADVLGKLRRRERDYRVQVDPEAARNLPLPHAVAAPSSVPVPGPVPAAPATSQAPAQPAPERPPRGIHDTLLGIRCRATPPMWFQTVSEAGRRWVLESMNSAGQIEIESAAVPTRDFEDAKLAFCQRLAERFQGAEFSEARTEASGAGRCMELDVTLLGEDLHHRFVMLWKQGRAVSLHLSNTRRFFLYDVQAFTEMVKASELV